MKPLTLLFVAIVLFGGQGCLFNRLKEDLKQLDHMAYLQVQVEAPDEAEGPVVVALLAPAEIGMSIASYGVASASGEIGLPAPPGPHYLVGYQDLNGNFKYDPGEPAGRYGEPSLLQLESGNSSETVRLRVSWEGGDLDNWPTEFLGDARAATMDPRTSNIGEIVSIDDPRFDPEIGSQGQWAPAAFIAAGDRTGVYFLEAYDSQKPPVLLVHGIGGSPLAFAPMVKVLQEAGLQPWLFYYPSGVRLDRSSALLARCIRELKATYGQDSLQIVGHSMGGLVALGAVSILAQEDGTGFCDKLITLSAPLGGLRSAEVGADFSPAVVPSWRDLAPDSAFLAQLPGAQPKGVPHILFFTIGGPRISVGTSDGVVSLQSQLREEFQDSAARLIAVNATHVGILSDERALRLLADELQR